MWPTKLAPPRPRTPLAARRAAGLLALTAGLAPAWAQTEARSPVRVTVNQTPIVLENQPPVERGGRILVPLRGVLERLGAFVRYDADTRTVIAFREATNITLPVGSRRALVGDRAVTLDTPAFILNNSVLVPLRFVAEALGARVFYDVGTRTVAINTEDGDSAAPPDAAPVVGVTLTGTVVAVYSDLAPRRIVVRVPDRTGSPAEKTIPLRPNATISVRRPNSLLAVTLDRVHAGDRVEVLQTREGQATSIEVTARAAVATPPKPRPAPANDRLFRGEFLEAKRLSAGRWVLKMTDGRLIEVPGNVPIQYGSDKIGVDDLRSGDALTITVDPKTRQGTRIVVAVER